MKKIYTQQDLGQFFKQFKELPNSCNLEKVHQTIYNPDAKVKYLVKPNFKPFKLIIMASPFIIGFASIIIWLTPNVVENKTDKQDLIIQQTAVRNHKIDGNKNEIIIDETQVSKESKQVNKPIKSAEIKAKSGSLNKVTTVTEGIINNENTKYKHKTDNNQKVADFVINKNVKHAEYEAKNIPKGVQFIELSKNELMELGFEINDDKITIITKSKGWKIVLSKRMKGVIRHMFSLREKSKPKPIFLSNINGKQMLKWRSAGDNKNKMEDDYFKNTIQELIPVILRQSDFPEILDETQVFWFEPTIELFESLPDRIAVQLEEEYNYITAETEEERTELSSNCTYFEACKTSMLVESCKLYPNPARQSTSIEFFVPESIKGSISIANITGAQIRILVSNTTFEKGSNLYKLDLSGINSGIYFVLIQISKGYKTQRLIISK